MSRELEPCPFCGREVSLAFQNDMVVCDARKGGCGASSGRHKNAKEATKAWNTRYKRTCKLIMHDGSPACSECLAEQDYDARFCDQCGAEVADGD